MQKSIWLGSVFAASLAFTPALAQDASAQSNWPVFSGKSSKSTSGDALRVDPERGVLSLSHVIERVSPAVVDISVDSKVRVPRQSNPFGNDDFFERFFGDRANPFGGQGGQDNDDDDDESSNERTSRSAGSGVIINAGKGYILTNYHVIDKADKITVRLTDRRTGEATLVGGDKGTDIALLKIDLDDLTDVTLADSDDTKVGDYVIAIGNAFGIGQTVTSGIVSALGRSTGGRNSYQDFIQTDAAINKGNSGGALLNSKGELIGVNSAILSSSGGSNGIGFAVPTNMITSIMDQLIAYGEVRRGRIGVLIQNITPELQSAMDLDSRDGALISQVVEDSPAEKAGLEPGDVITKFNGQKILDSSDIRNAVGFVERGSRASISYLRDGKTYTTKITVEAAPESDDDDKKPADEPKADTSSFKAFDGATLTDIPDDLDPTGGDNGVLIASVKRGSDAEEAGLKRGDIIRAVNNTKVKDLDAFKDAIEGRTRAVALTVQRGRNQIYIAVK